MLNLFNKLSNVGFAYYANEQTAEWAKLNGSWDPFVKEYTMNKKQLIFTIGHTVFDIWTER